MNSNHLLHTPLDASANYRRGLVAIGCGPYLGHAGRDGGWLEGCAANPTWKRALANRRSARHPREGLASNRAPNHQRRPLSETRLLPQEDRASGFPLQQTLV